MKLKNKIIGLVATLTFFSCGAEKPLRPKDEFAQCLTKQGMAMYGTSWCGFCTAQKKKFGTSFQYIDYVDCDEQANICHEEGVSAYPTWKKDGESYVGLKPLERLAEISGCELNLEEESRQD